MKQDIRVYYYENGVLHKYYNLKKSYSSIDEAKKAIDEMNNRITSRNIYFNVRYKKTSEQIVLVEYFGNYKSKIVEIIN